MHGLACSSNSSALVILSSTPISTTVTGWYTTPRPHWCKELSFCRSIKCTRSCFRTGTTYVNYDVRPCSRLRGRRNIGPPKGGCDGCGTAQPWMIGQRLCSALPQCVMLGTSPTAPVASFSKRYVLALALCLVL